MTAAQMLFGVFPYVAIILGVVVTLWRYFGNRFSYSSLSSQFLENRQLFWGSVPWHYGILFILTGHLVGFLIPGTVLAWNSLPLRLYILESTALAFGLLALWGLIVLIFRRALNARIRAVTSIMDVVLLIVFLAQVAAGVGIAVFYRWGSSWYAGLAAPYLWSILALNPDVGLISNLPFLVQFHVVGAFVILALLPFTRLVHLLSLPYSYLWRPYQLVIWNRRAEARAEEKA